jgi:hypothetical protein
VAYECLSYRLRKRDSPVEVTVAEQLDALN